MRQRGGISMGLTVFIELTDFPHGVFQSLYIGQCLIEPSTISQTVLSASYKQPNRGAHPC